MQLQLAPLISVTPLILLKAWRALKYCMLKENTTILKTMLREGNIFHNKKSWGSIISFLFLFFNKSPEKPESKILFAWHHSDHSSPFFNLYLCKIVCHLVGLSQQHLRSWIWISEWSKGEGIVTRLFCMKRYSLVHLSLSTINPNVSNTSLSCSSQEILHSGSLCQNLGFVSLPDSHTLLLPVWYLQLCRHRIIQTPQHHCD